jgi:hypothetical protein
MKKKQKLHRIYTTQLQFGDPRGDVLNSTKMEGPPTTAIDVGCISWLARKCGCGEGKASRRPQ